MIKSLSPYYVTTPWVNPLGGAVLGESYTISIFVWNGSLAFPPVTATYTKTQPNPANLTDSDRVNIARLIADFIEFAPQKALVTSAIDGNNTYWVTTSITYENDATVQQEVTDSFSLGYTYGNEGENVTTIINNILLTTQDYKVDRQGVFVMPVLANFDSSLVYQIRVEADGGIVEALECIGALDADTVLYPSGYKAGKIYAQVSTKGLDDSVVDRNSVRTRRNDTGLIETLANNVPALTYLEGDNCPVLNLEPQATNFFLRSQEFDDNEWDKTNSTIIANSVISPDGSLTADSIIDNATDSSHRVQVAISVTTGVEYTQAIFVQRTANRFVYIGTNNFSFWDSTWFDLDLLIPTITPSGVTSSIEQLPNGWVKIIASKTSNATGFFNFLTGSSPVDGITGYIGSGVNSLNIWQADLVELPYATSPIYTQAVGETRLLDIVENSGDINSFNDNEWVHFIKASALFDDGTDRFYSISDETLDERIYISYSSVSNQIAVDVYAGGVSQALMTYTVADVTVLTGIGIRGKLNDCSLWIDGIERATDTNCIMPTGLKNKSYHDGIGGKHFLANIEIDKSFKTFLTDEQMFNLGTTGEI